MLYVKSNLFSSQFHHLYKSFFFLHFPAKYYILVLVKIAKCQCIRIYVYCDLIITCNPVPSHYIIVYDCMFNLLAMTI